MTYVSWKPTIGKYDSPGEGLGEVAGGRIVTQPVQWNGPADRKEF